MKTYFTYLTGLILAAALIFMLSRRSGLNESEPELVEASIAGFNMPNGRITMCTPQKFLLDDVDKTKPIAPLFGNLGSYQFKISTDNPEAQSFFDQGVKLTFGFNHAEAHRSFMETERIDSGNPMALWGQAYALGPNINDPFPDEERRMKAFEAVEKAKSLINAGSEKEKDLINALAARYSSDTSADLNILNENYRQEMEKLAAKYPDDADILTLFADAAMNTRPWDYWDKNGNPHPNIPEAKEALEKAFTINPEHPGAHHLYIHMVELPFPELGVPSAEKLAGLMPGSGHLVHMPSHIYIRVGRYDDAVKSNMEAVAADEDYIAQCFSQGIYPLSYYPHNIHFLWSAASLMGDSKLAIEAARKTAEKTPASEMTTLPFLQDYASTPLLAYTRFGKWNEILTIPPYGTEIKHINLIRHYARGIAFVRKNNIAEAEEELAALVQLRDDPDLATLIANYTNPSSSIGKVAAAALEGEISAAKGDYNQAIEILKQGVAFEDDLAYSEPTAWHIPVRQTLGSTLMKAGKAKEAEQAYRADLKINRDNGWSLMGLHKSLMSQGKTQEAESIKKKFDEVWSRADIEIEDSVL